MTTKLSARDKKLLLYTGLALLILGFVQFIIRPALAVREVSQTQLALAAEEEAQARMKLGTLPQVEAALEQNRKLLTQAEAALYTAMPNDKVDELVTGLELAHGLVPLSLDIARGEMPKGYILEAGVPAAPAAPDKQEYFITMKAGGTAQGTREDFIRLLDTVQKDYPAVRVVSFDFRDTAVLTGTLATQEVTQISFALEIYGVAK